MLSLSFFLQQVQSDHELNSLTVLATRRRLRLGDLEDDEDAALNASRAAAADLLSGRVGRVEVQV